MAKSPPKQPEKKPTSRSGRLFWLLFSLFLLITGGLVALAATYAQTYEGKIFPGVTIGSLDIGGKTFDEARKITDSAIDHLLSQGFVVMVDGNEKQVSPLVMAWGDPDLSRELVTFDRTEAIEKAIHFGHERNPFKNTFNQVAARFQPKHLPVGVHINQPEFEKAIKTQFASIISPAKNASLIITWPETPNRNTPPEIFISPAMGGTNIDINSIWLNLETKLSQLEQPTINLHLVPEAPTITIQEAHEIPSLANQFLTTGPWLVHSKKQTWTFSPHDLSPLLGIKKNNHGLVQLAFTGSGLEAFFSKIETTINQPARNAKFSMENGKVTEFQGSANGVTLDRAATQNLMENGFLNNKMREIEIATKVTVPDITTRQVNNLGIEEVLGVGISNFRNSPGNRIKNIKNGAKLLNGLLIKPDEEFSLLNALRPFNASNGYLPELVIKGDKIEPELGGGLCQIGTTTFRATMNSGLPITMRQNHSLVVSYYNDPSNNNPGTDATIYDPAPDFRFKNDTGAYILLATETDSEKSELRFTFWGKPDGRKGYYSPPVVQRWIPYGEPKKIETTNLKPEEEKCQAAHPGADTSFTYTIEQADETKNETVYTSHYRALPKICLIGVEKLTPPPDQIPLPDSSTNNPLPPSEAADAIAN